MCGIFGYVGKRKDGQKIVFDGLKSLEYRGYDSWGVGVVPSDVSGRIAVKKRTGKIGNSNVDDLPGGSLSFGHTRWATHGGVTQANAHPHLDCSGKIAIIHNGIFENYEEVKNKLLSGGHKFISETDTETLTHLIEDNAKKATFSEAVRAAFNKMDGLNAVIAVSTKEKSLVAARNGSPLVIGFGKNENFLASDAAALLPYTRNVYFLEDNEMAILTPDGVNVLDVKSGKKITPDIKKLDWKIENGEKGKYESYMLKEIFEQPQIISDIATSGAAQAEEIAEIVRKARGTYLVGCGTASYACLAGSYLFSKLAKRHVNPAIGSEFGYSLDFLNKDSLVIAISQSGETMDILESVKKAKDRGAKILSLVNVQGSSLYRLSDYKMMIGAGQERAVASTKAFTGMIGHLILLANSLNGGVRGGQKSLIAGAASINEVLSTKSLKNIDKLASQIVNNKHIYVIGRGLSYPASLETALKIKEISYIHAEGLAAGELKHGPLALIEKGTPCISFLPNDETYGANLAGAMEMKARGGYIIGISYKPHEIFDYYINVPDAGEASIIPEVVVAQVLAYYLTLKKGLDPDKPRNLAKSVTVK
ncbi:MAG: glucosamine/fructose-6-phosphate aminotransferase, isomerizing, glucosamine-fructose-6-phosphate aminotransferase (isomerizing) [Microgenomates group bacterium GW2011_GWC1_41_20]|uniref:Glutamine--fructose-6-phosphate aminotransferase [isomerizing] n=2 Tax=Candidatus Woeseibacteriota TaxID=1752722 RepID=A0A0G0VV17_9BACT|nr:MAG: glucosamine/fructose-6-phosphate aminotransferase, isomerizing, glucosamine-fructose-6-phosphate aminotransferase (isomerizing) [Microgenomates group bacterium GW2011_GWC1_41_20]KKS04674.1 MAG: Glucosamine/fructose-6-phosphate aminotransferase, isomerizing [Candidatus Woesebacteria bacterium GW2011_GWE1_41_24]